MSDKTPETDDEVEGVAGAGSGKEKFKAPKDGSWVPVERLKDVSRKLKVAREELAVERQKAGSTVPPPKVWSLPELNAEVTAGRLTQDAANQVWEDQIVDRAAGKVRTVATAETQRQRQTAELADYQRLIPALEDPASPEFERVEKEYEYYLKHLSMPDTPGTMLVAARAVLGPIDTIREAKAATVKGGESYRETPGGKGGGSRTPTTLEGLDERQKTYYQRAISQGAYSGWDAVEAELAAVDKRRARA